MRLDYIGKVDWVSREGKGKERKDRERVISEASLGKKI